MKEFIRDTVFEKISEVANDKGLQAYVVGGYVRDVLLGRDCKDIDIVVIGDGIKVAKEVSKHLKGASNVSVFKNFGTAMFRYKDMEIEFVGARKESYSRNSRKPIVSDGTLEDDQNRRDFTINTLAISLNNNDHGTLIDPFNGQDDLKKRLIRTPLDPATTFSDDPLRMLRAIRFATQLDFDIDNVTFEGIKQNIKRISIISQERITDELNKILASDVPSKGFKLLDESALLSIILPELIELKGVDAKNGRFHKEVFHHSLKVLDNVCKESDNIWLRWAALLHDIAKPKTKKYYDEQGWTFYGHDYVGSKMIPDFFRKMKLPLNDKMRYVKKMVALHLRPIALVKEEVTDSAVRRLLFDAGDDIEDLMLLCEADVTSKNEERVKKYLKNFKLVRKKLKDIEEKDAIRNFQPPISGELIIETFGIKPTKTVGILKNAIKEAILEGEIHNNYDEAYDYMLKIANGLGLKPKK